jgi:uncharacterized protein YecA (UPF0149 family)
MSPDPMSERFEKNRKKKQLDDLGLRHRSTEEVEAEDEAVRKAKEQRDKNPGKYQLKHQQEVGRNDPCPCGSGKKYKKCCGAEK